MKRIGSSKKKTRNISTKPSSEKGKFPIKGITQKFSVGEKVVLKSEPSIHNGLYFRRFHGKTGKVLGIAGGSYTVSVRDGNKYKMIVVSPVHMVRL